MVENLNSHPPTCFDHTAHLDFGPIAKEQNVHCARSNTNAETRQGLGEIPTKQCDEKMLFAVRVREDETAD